MKKLIALIGVAAIALATVTTATAQATYVSPQGIYIDGTTNTSVNAGGTITPANVIAAATTNYFNLSTTPGNQSNTNLWPAVSLTASGVAGRMVFIGHQFACGGANSGIVTYNWAPSDGTRFYTNNLLSVVVTASGASTVTSFTNWDSGGCPFLVLYSAANTNGSTYVTNNYIGLRSKRN